MLDPHLHVLVLDGVYACSGSGQPPEFHALPELRDEDVAWLTRHGEQEFLRELGARVGALHGYIGNSWLTPRDDHPCVSAVARLDGRGLLQVGVARPEPLYVILPHDGRPVLHCGAVLSYRETLGGLGWSDAAWRGRGADTRPPAFTVSFRR